MATQSRGYLKWDTTTRRIIWYRPRPDRIEPRFPLQEMTTVVDARDKFGTSAFLAHLRARNLRKPDYEQAAKVLKMYDNWRWLKQKGAPMPGAELKLIPTQTEELHNAEH